MNPHDFTSSNCLRLLFWLGPIVRENYILHHEANQTSQAYVFGFHNTIQTVMLNYAVLWAFIKWAEKEQEHYVNRVITWYALHYDSSAFSPASHIRYIYGSYPGTLLLNPHFLQAGLIEEQSTPELTLLLKQNNKLFWLIAETHMNFIKKTKQTQLILSKNHHFTLYPCDGLFIIEA